MYPNFTQACLEIIDEAGNQALECYGFRHVNPLAIFLAFFKDKNTDAYAFLESLAYPPINLSYENLKAEVSKYYSPDDLEKLRNDVENGIYFTPFCANLLEFLSESYSVVTSTHLFLALLNTVYTSTLLEERGVTKEMAYQFFGAKMPNSSNMTVYEEIVVESRFYSCDSIAYPAVLASRIGDLIAQLAMYQPKKSCRALFVKIAGICYYAIQRIDEDEKKSLNRNCQAEQIPSCCNSTNSIVE